MTLYVYAITDRPDEPLPDRPGLQDEALGQVVWRDIGAVVSERGAALREVDTDDVWRHEEVIESLMIGRTALPARFGTLLSRQQLDDTLCRAYSELVLDLERVRGHVEIGVRFLTIAEPEVTAGAAPRNAAAASDISTEPGALPGTAYLLTKLAAERELRARRQRRLELVREVFEMLRDQASAGKLDDTSNERGAISAAFLVPRDRIPSFQSGAGRAADAHPELALLCTGPWPPYSFVTTGANSGAW